MKILLLFSYGISLQYWNNIGIIDREISLYKKLLEKGLEFEFLTYGNEQDLKFKHLLQKIEIIPILNRVKSKNSILMLLKSLFLPLTIKNVFKNINIIKTNQVNGCWIGILTKVLYHKKLIIRGGYEWFRNYTSKSKVQKIGTSSYLKYLFNYFYIFITELIAYKLADVIILTNRSDIDFIIKTFKLKHKKKRFIVYIILLI